MFSQICSKCVKYFAWKNYLGQLTEGDCLGVNYLQSNYPGVIIWRIIIQVPISRAAILLEAIVWGAINRGVIIQESIVQGLIIRGAIVLEPWNYIFIRIKLKWYIRFA